MGPVDWLAWFLVLLNAEEASIFLGTQSERHYCIALSYFVNTHSLCSERPSLFHKLHTGVKSAVRLAGTFNKIDSEEPECSISKCKFIVHAFKTNPSF